MIYNSSSYCLVIVLQTFCNFTSHPQPGKCRTSDNRTSHPPPTESDGRCLGAVFDLAQAAVGAAGCLLNRLCEEFRRHEMGAGAGGEVAAVLYQTQTANIDLAVALMAFLTELRDFVKAGGSRITTSNCSPFASNSGSRSKTFRRTERW